MYHPQNPQSVLSLRHRVGLATVPLGLLLLWLTALIPLYLPNMGGSGLKLPHNIITWGLMAAVVATIWLTQPAAKAVHLTVTARWALLAIVILAIPLIYTPPHWREAALARWLALFGGWVFYFSLLQYRMHRVGRHGLYYVILAAVTFQALIALLQFTVPGIIPAGLAYPMQGGRVYGVFQQANVLASFLATGLALALMLFLSPTFACSRPRHERLRARALGLLLIMFPVVLVWLQSRIGWVGGTAVALLFITRFHHLAPLRTQWAACLLSLGLLMGVTVLLHGLYAQGGLRYVSHDFSNQARYTMLRDTLAMIIQKPLSGWGYGGFEYSFQHFRLAQTPPVVITEIARHPHNELLLWWVEGGLVALMGMLLLLVSGLRLIIAALKTDRARSRLFKHPAGDATALCIVLLPMLLHTQTEYPFTLSAAHWAIFLLLLAQLDKQVGTLKERLSVPAATATLLRTALPMIALPLCVLAGTGLYANLALTASERNQLVDIEPARQAMAFDPWVNTERWDYDRQTHALLTFNHSRDPQLLEGYARWASHYLSRRIDKNVYASWIAIAHSQQDPLTQRRLLQEAQTLFPDDQRFMPPMMPPHPEAVL